MSPIPDDDQEAARQERTIGVLTAHAPAPVEHIRRLFAGEFARLGRGAKVRDFLHVLTTSNVRAMLRAMDKAARTS
jgi:hypothetical protein